MTEQANQPAASSTYDPLGSAAFQAQQGQTPAEPAEPAAPAPVEPSITSQVDQAPAKDNPPAPSELKFTLPDGFQADQAALSSFTEIAKEAGLSQEAGQKLVDLFVQQQTASSEASTQAFEKMQQTWHDQILADPVMGGSNAAKTQETLGKALDSYGDQATRDAFRLTGAGNNPDIVRFIHKMATALSEGTFVAPKGPAANATPRTRGEILYGDQPQQ